MNRLLIIWILLHLISCKPERRTGELYISNYSFDKFDSALIKVTVDNEIIYEDTVVNQHLSYYWEEGTFKIPSDSFRVLVDIRGLGFELKADTTLPSRQELEQMFITFNFYPYHKRYSNPEIYSHLNKDGEFHLKSFADSLYENGLLKNAADYLNDTVPLRSNIEIIFKKPEKQVLE